MAAVLFLYGNNLEAQVKSFYVVESKVEQGGILVFQIGPYWMPPATSNPAIFIFEKHYKPNEEGTVFVGVGLDTQSGKYDVVFYENGIWQCCDKEEIEVLAMTFEKTRISRYTGKPTERTDRQKRDIDKAFDNAVKSDGSVDFTGGLSYIDPLCFAKDVIDSFGFIYRNNPYRKHEGVDLRAPVGMPVRATNAGKVILAVKNYRGSPEGNMIILSHGLGIFSIYMHLSGFHVKQGDIVKRGQLIALSGRTGVGVSEPHLHFSIKIQDSYVEPLEFIETVSQYLGR
ncbi:MAG: M23 family metallopeptidase [Candidatus Yanofskybacteria bacterium]|nr:M23 family metallopeptidase [Candidatus Yanofskybacteria bacterium]